MEFRQLRYFEAVARTLNFSKASEELCIAQPPLSRQIKNLEDELGVILIDRSSRPIKLTDAGSFFYEQSIQIIGRMNELKLATKRVAKNSRKRITIGLVPTTLYTKIPSAIKTFIQENDNVDIGFLPHISVEQIDFLKAGKIDIGFGRIVIHDDAIKNIVLADERLYAIVPMESRLAKNDEISLKELTDEKLILFPASPRPSFADQVIFQFRVRGIDPSNTYETDSLQTTMGLVAAGMGYSLVPESVMVTSRPDIKYIALKEQDVVTQLIMSVRKNDLSSHLKKFSDHIESTYAKNKELHL